VNKVLRFAEILKEETLNVIDESAYNLGIFK